MNPAPPLLPRVALGEPEAVRECIERHGALVWSMARRFSPSAVDAEDAVQEIFLDLWKSASRFDAAGGSESVFVATIARRRLIDRLRAGRRRPNTEPISESRFDAAAGISSGPDGETCAEASIAAAAVAALRPEQREVLLLAVQHGMSHEEIAKRMRLPLGTVKTHARRALERVRASLADARTRKAVSS